MNEVPKLERHQDKIPPLDGEGGKGGGGEKEKRRENRWDLRTHILPHKNHCEKEEGATNKDEQREK